MPAVAYDITRLKTRILNATPNGIDRIDFMLARHFVSKQDWRFIGISAQAFFPRVIDSAVAARDLAAIESHWGETCTPEEDPCYCDFVARINGEMKGASARSIIKSGRRGQLLHVSKWLLDFCVPHGPAPKNTLPLNSVYFNASQFPMWIPSYFKWLEGRPDVKALFFIHDLLPLERPADFGAGEYWRHQKRLAVLARFATAAVVASEVVKEKLTDHVKKLGRAQMPIIVASVPAASHFTAAKVLDPRLKTTRYFLYCSTIEPRKNHVLLLRIWNKLIDLKGRDAPKLVFVGRRGWKFGGYVDFMRQNPQLQEYVIELSGLTSPSLKRLLDNSCGVVIPTFGEGFGLPVREALAAGVPVIASDIPVFRKIADPNLLLLNASDEEGWLRSILKLLDASPDGGRPSRESKPVALTSFAELDAFIADL